MVGYINYIYICVTILIITIGLLVIISSSYYLGTFREQTNFITISSYECGFTAFEEARWPFDISFYLLSVLYLIFDLEIILLMPWALTLCYNGIFTFYLIVIFVIIILLGFYYEWLSGILNKK